MTQKTYSEILKDPRWQKKRLEILNRDEFTCIACYNNKATLHVHHLTYLKGKNPWEYDNRFLVTLCEMCHEGQKGIDLRFAFANAGVLENDAVTLAAFIKFISNEFVTDQILTPQTIWSMLCLIIDRFNIDKRTFVDFLVRFRKELK